MKKIIIIILIVLLAGVGIFVYLRIKNNKTSQTNPQDIKRAEFLQKQTQFNNSIQTIVQTDSDADGLSNADEAKYKTDPNNADTDGDGLTDKIEISVYHTDPLKADTDGDSFPDGKEVRYRTNPLDAKSHPTK